MFYTEYVELAEKHIKLMNEHNQLLKECIYRERKYQEQLSLLSDKVELVSLATPYGSRMKTESGE